ncbi:MAG: hypothetical protein J6X89_05980 [Bacteroidales bacterium]|nr:hypothetical protein [Bacteroidales bacterium]
MKHLARFCRLIAGLVFICSGFLKLLSPVGTSLIIKEYLTAFHLGFMAPAAMVLGIALASLEFLTGVALLLRLRFAHAAWIALVLISAFTPLTLYLAVFNPIADCGCFGEAIHLTNWQTFFKNLILLPCTIIMFIGRHKVAEGERPVAEWIFVCLFALLAAAVLLQTFLWAPLAEFTAYKVGSEIKSAPVQSVAEQYETEFRYEKDGDVQTFTLDNLPDSTWTFVEAITTLKGEDADAADSDFLIEADGVDISAELLGQRKLLLMSIYHPDKFMQRHSLDEVYRIKKKADKQGLSFALASSGILEGMPDEIPVNRADVKLLMTLNRSNGGVTLLDEGVVIRKWPYVRAASESVNFCGDQDPELTLLMTVNRQRMSLGIVLVAFILLCLAKFRVFYKKKE